MSVGRLIRQLRQARGWSQGRLATELNQRAGDLTITREYISRRWESGKVTPSPYWSRHLADVFGIAVKDLEADDVQRREFLVTAAGLAMTSLPLSRVGRSDVQRLYRRTARLRRLDDIMGGADTYPLYAAETRATAGLIGDVTNSTRSLTALLAEQEQMTGWAAFDAGRHETAREHYETSLSAATEAGERALAGNALAFLAYQMTATSRDAVDTAEASYQAAQRDATPKVKALLLERLAWSYAVAGLPVETARALDRSRDALHARDDRPEPDWVFWVNDDEIDIMTGRCWARLGKPHKSIPALAPALSRMSDTCARDKSLYLTGLANAYVDADDLDRAAETVMYALDLAEGVASVRPPQQLRGVAGRLAARGAVSEPLQERLRPGD